MEAISFTPLLLISLLAFLVPLLTSFFKKLFIPVMVGEILCGMVIGKSGLDLIPDGPWLSFLSHFGFAYLMFLSGIELDFDLMRPRKITSSGWSLRRCFSEPLYLSISIFLLRLLISTCAAWFFWKTGLASQAWLMTLILSTTSLGVVLMILKEQGSIEGDFGQILLATSVLADLITVVLMTMGFIYYTHGWDHRLFLVGLLFLAVLVADWIKNRLEGIPLVRRVFVDMAHATSQLRVRGVFALMLIFVVFAQSLGAEVILGAFLAGALVSKISRGEIPNLQLKLDAIGYGFFIPIFFIMVGVNFDLHALTASSASLVLIPVLIVTAYAVNLLSGLLLYVRFNWRETLAGGILLSARLSLIVAAAAIGLEMGAISPALNSAIIIMALSTCMTSPVLFNYLMKTEIRPTRFIQIVGAGTVGLELARRLRERGIPTVILEKDIRTYQKAMQFGFRVQYGDGTNPDFLALTGIFAEDILILTTREDEVNLTIASLARDLFQVDRIIARLNHPDALRQYRDMDIRTVDFKRQVTLALENMIIRPNIFDVLVQEATANEFQEITLGNPSIHGKPLEEIRLPGNSLILFVKRNDDLLIPHGKTRLYRKDLIALCGDLDSVLRAREYLEGPTS